MGKLIIKSSVGRKAKNDFQDVWIIVKLINHVISTGLLRSQKIDVGYQTNMTIGGDKSAMMPVCLVASKLKIVENTIKSYQKKRMKTGNADGRIDPHGKTMQSLLADQNRGTLPLYINLVMMPNNGIAQDLWSAGVRSMLDHISDHRLRKFNLITLVDFRLNSRKKRMWVIDLKTNTTKYYCHVSHGKNSGKPDSIPNKFSNKKGSNQSSLGAFVTLHQRKAKAGQRGKTDLSDNRKRRKAMVVEGLEACNSLARRRGIIFHGAFYVKPHSNVNRHKVGRSLGCFATEQAINDKLIDDIEQGSFIYTIGTNIAKG